MLIHERSLQHFWISCLHTFFLEPNENYRSSSLENVQKHHLFAYLSFVSHRSLEYFCGLQRIQRVQKESSGVFEMVCHC